jgi:hypothetical protein
MAAQSPHSPVVRLQGMILKIEMVILYLNCPEAFDSKYFSSKELHWEDFNWQCCKMRRILIT